MTEYKIYTLTCPLDGNIKYVGATIQDLKIRLAGHCSAREGTHDKEIWIESLKIKKLKPVIEVLETIQSENKTHINYIEQYWINQFKQWGFELYNGIHYSVNNRKGRSPQEYLEFKYKKDKQFYKQLKQLRK